MYSLLVLKIALSLIKKNQSYFTARLQFYMNVMYRVSVSILDDIELEKICALVADSFDRNIGISHLRSFDYAILVTSKGLYIGCLFVDVRREIEHNIQSLCVDPRFRNQGLARRMLASVKCGLESSSEYASLHVDASPSRDMLVSFYEKSGFDVVYSNETETFMCYYAL